MKKILTTISAGLVCCVFFDAGGSVPQPSVELTYPEMMQGASLLVREEPGLSIEQARDRIRATDPQDVRNFIQRELQRERNQTQEEADLATARQLQQQFDEEAEGDRREREAEMEEEMLRLQEIELARQGLDPQTQNLVAQYAAEEEIEAYRNRGQRQQLAAQHAEEEARTQQVLDDEALARAIAEEEQMRADAEIAHRLGAGDGMGGIPPMHQRLPERVESELRAQLSRLDGVHHGGFLQMYESGNEVQLQQLVDRLWNLDPFQEPDAGNARNTLMGMMEGM